MYKCVVYLMLALIFMNGLSAQEIEVSDIKVNHKNGQTFITWKDVAEGEEGAKYSYSVYRSTQAITDENKGKPYMYGILNNSGILFGKAFNKKDRASGNAATTFFEIKGEPLPKWYGLAVVTTDKPGNYFYAVVACDLKNNPVTKIIADKSSTTSAIAEEVKAIQPFKLYDSKERGQYSANTCLTGKEGLPLHFELHASNAQGGGAGEYGDYYLYFSRPEWGYRDGLPGVFSILETRDPKGNFLSVTNRDTIENPNGASGFETFWFGYVCVPQWAEHKEPRAYPFTERRVLWVLDYCINTYKADKNRIYCGGGSMGAWGTTSFGFRQKNIFAAVYPNRPRTIQRGMPSIVSVDKNAKVMMDDGVTEYLARMDSVAFATKEKSDLPFYAWCCGRRDGFATWKEQIDMVNALKNSHHGFAFAWNDGDHSSGADPMKEIVKWYPRTRFALNISYPAFSNSSIDGNLGNGDPKDGDMVGGINLGFKWVDPVESKSKWVVEISNELCKDTMTVDVTPRRCQTFIREPNAEYKWETSLGDKGSVKADSDGVIVVEKVKMEAGKVTRLTIEKN